MRHPYDQLECEEGIEDEDGDLLGHIQVCDRSHVKAEYKGSEEDPESDHGPEKGHKGVIAPSSEEHVDVIVKRDQGDNISIEAYTPSDDECRQDHLGDDLCESKNISLPYLAFADGGVAVGIIRGYDDVIEGQLPDAHDVEQENHKDMDHDYGNRKNLQDFLVIYTVLPGYYAD